MTTRLRGLRAVLADVRAQMSVVPVPAVIIHAESTTIRSYCSVAVLSSSMLVQLIA